MKIKEDNFVEQLLARNEKALEYVVDNYGWLIKSIVKKQLFHLESFQEDCMNDILFGVWENIRYFQPEKNTFQNWLAGITRYKCVDYLRKYIKEVNNQSWEDTVSQQETGEPFDFLEQEISKETEAMLNCLNDRDKELFRKLYLEECDMDRISQETGIKKEVIYNRVSRGKRRIRKLFPQSR